MKIAKKVLAAVLCLTMLLGIAPFGEFGVQSLFGIGADAANVSGSDIVTYARTFIGYPYGHGYGPKIFDCCGLVQYVYKHFGISLPWNCTDYKSYGSVVSASNAQPGDLVVWHGKHVGIVSKKGYLVNAMNSNDGVKEVKISLMTNGTPSYYIRIKGVNNSVASQPNINTANYEGGVKVSFTSQTSGRTIYYTLDGSTPTTPNSKTANKNTIKYDEKSIILTSTKTIKAVAYKSGMTDSGVVSKKVTVNKTEKPTISQSTTANGFNVTIKIPSGAKVYYTLDGTTPSVSASKINGTLYTAGITVSETTTIKAIAVKNGCTPSDVASLSLTASVPSVPTLKLTSANTIGIGDPINLEWNKISNASAYKLVVSGAVGETLDYDSTVAAYEPTKTGNYSFSVKAVNFKGESVASTPAVTVTVKPDVTVTFKADGKVYATQKVHYGKSAVAPANPSKEGYNFVSWSGDYTNVIKDITVSANFKAISYNITFYDSDGKTVKSSQSVDYGKSATAPSVTPPSGYKFTGWTLSNDDNCKGTSYTQVNGDAKFKPVFEWATPGLPVSVTVNSAVRSNDSKSYNVSVKVTNSENKVYNAKAITVIKTANDKVVATDISNITISAKASSAPFSFTVTSNENAMLCEVYIVNSDKDNPRLTGGALSAKASKAVTKTASTSVQEWTGWSDWSKEKVSETSTTDVETDVEEKIMYCYRDKTTVTSDNSSMDGYTKVGEKWVDQGNTTVEYADNLPAGSTTTKYFKTDSTYYKKYNNKSKIKTAADSTDTVKYEQVSKTTIGYLYWHWCYTHDAGSPLNCYLADHKGQVVSGSRTCNNFHSYFSTKALTYNSSRGCYVKNTKDNCPYQENWYAGLDNKQIPVYKYVFKTYKKQYTFEKWSNYSDWSETKPAESNTREVVSCTFYRYRTLETKSTTASTEYKVTENTSGTVYEREGKINNLNADYSGKQATVMVYRSTNADPTAEQLEYVGQITLGSGNSYSLKFIPLEEISESTGDYIISFGIAGTDKLINNVERIEAPKPEYTVQFRDLNGNVLKTQKVTKGSDATPPAIPEAEGYTVTWDLPYTNITSNKTISAIAKPESAKTLSVIFIDYANGTYTEQKNIKYGSTIQFPASPSAPGKTFKGWSVDANSKITETTIAEALYDDITYTVKFLNKDGSVFDTQTVSYGGYASIPEGAPTAEGYEFIAWDTGSAWWNVKSNVSIKPIFIFDQTVETPIVTDEETNFGTGALNLEAPTEGSVIHYTNDGSEPTEEDLIFDDIIWTEETTTFKAKAFKAGMNASDTIEVTIEVLPESDMPKISALENIAQYEIGKDYAKLCMKIENPYGLEIRAYGYQLTNETTGETKIYENTDINGSTEKVIGKVFTISGLDAGTYSYSFFVEFDDFVLGTSDTADDSIPNSFTIPGNITPNPDPNSNIDIRTPSTTTVKYGYTLVLHLSDKTKIPDGTHVSWKYEGTGFKVEDKGDECYVTVTGKGNVTVTAVLCKDGTNEAVKDSDGNPVSDSVTLTGKAGFFQKLVYFFKNLFGANLFIDK